MSDFRLTGAEDLARLARDLRAAGDVTLRRELYAGLNRSTKPLREELRRSAAETLPHHGGLAARVAGASMTTRTRAVGSGAGVRILVRARSGRPVDVDAADRGQVRHPTYGHRPLVRQSVRTGWFARPFARHADEVRRELLRVIDDIAARLRRG